MTSGWLQVRSPYAQLDFLGFPPSHFFHLFPIHFSIFWRYHTWPLTSWRTRHLSIHLHICHNIGGLVCLPNYRIFMVHMCAYHSIWTKLITLPLFSLAHGYISQTFAANEELQMKNFKYIELTNQQKIKLLYCYVPLICSRPYIWFAK